MEDNINIDSSIFIKFTEVIKQFYDVKANELERHNVNPVHIKILHFLIDHEGCNQQTIADVRDVKRSTISTILDQMEGLELIVREKSKQDKRMINIFLTTSGREIGEYIRNTYEEYCSMCMKDFTCEEKEIFYRGMKKFTDVYEDNR